MRKLTITVTLIAICLVGLLTLFPITLTYIYFGFREFFPDFISWDAKDAHRKCEGAIAGSIDWPSIESQACLAMHMCANEAVLSDEQYSFLLSEIEKLQNCEAP